MASVSDVSVVVPVWNEESRLQSCVRDLRNLCKEWEIIIVDGGSEDGTFQSAEKLAPDCLLVAEKGRGFQMHQGARRATRDGLLFLHVDTRLPKDAPYSIGETLADSRFSGGAFQVRHDADGCGPIARRFLGLLDWRSGHTSLPYGDQAVFTSQEIYEKIGGMPCQPLMEDLEFSKRLRRYKPIRVLPGPVHVSARRFARRPWRSFLCWNLFPTFYACGVSPERLARWYGKPEEQ